MNFLELCQRVCLEVGTSGSGPTSVTGQSGEYARIVTWVASADEDIQRARAGWNFMRSSFSVQTVSGQAAYSATDCGITSFRDWVLNRFKIHRTSSGVSGEYFLNPITYDAWDSIYNVSNVIDGMPIDFTILENRKFSLGPVPNDIFTIRGEYQKSVTRMTANSDTPIYPEEYHLLAAYRAMMSYGRYTGANEVYQDAYNRYHEMMFQMEMTQLQPMLIAGPLL